VPGGQGVAVKFAGDVTTLLVHKLRHENYAVTTLLHLILHSKFEYLLHASYRVIADEVQDERMNTFY
jgi:hypothetical protein